METVLKINGGLERIKGYLTKTPLRSFLSAVLIYTVLTAVISFPTVISELIRTGSLLGYDSGAQYFPFLIKFREDLITFFDSIVNGSPVIPMLDPDYAYGADTFVTCAPDFLPFLPYYIFSVFLPEESMALFYGVGTTLLTYIAGISFIYMCRYFECDMLLAGISAPLYVLCGGYMFTGLYNQHFLYMYIAMPLFIAGIDRIIRGKSIVLFVMTTFWISLNGFVFLVYTIPFVVLFALIRVYFVHKGEYRRRLPVCFLKGAGAFLTGALMAGAIHLPVLWEYFTGSRTGSGSVTDYARLLIPDAEYLSNMTVPSGLHLDTGICAVCIPVFIFALVSLEKMSELRIYGIVSMILVSLPLIRYGLNGFQYSLCRWGFIPALLICFIFAKALPEIMKQDRKQLILTCGVTLCYILLVCADLYDAASVFIVAASLIVAIPPLRRLCGKASGLVSGLVGGKYSHILKMCAVTVSCLVSVIYLAYVIVFVNKILPLLLMAALLTSAAAIASYKLPELRTLCSCSLILLLMIPYIASYYSSDLIEFVDDFICTVDDFYGAAPTMEFLKGRDPDGTFGRIAFIGSETNSYGEYDEQKTTETKTENSSTEEAESDDYSSMNAALRYGYPDSCIFRSIMDSELMTLMMRCGQDANSLLSRVNMSEFGGKDVLYSLFGIRYLYSFDESRYFYGRELVNRTPLDDEHALYYYVNRYALPAGVTYSRTMDSSRFGSFDAAELPFAMMNEVYLEGSPLSENVKDSDASYARRCSIQHEKTSRGITSYGIECHDNKVVIEDDVSGCFIFLSFDGVKVIKSPGQDNEYLTVMADRERNCYFSIHNRAYDWPWSIWNDHYTLSLGFFENGVNELEFVSPFEYSDLYVTAVPVSEYVSAYNELTRETLRDVEMSVNTLKGDITVSDDRVLSVGFIYSDGWKAYVDGVQTPVYRANGLFLGIPLEKGSHKIELRYTTPYLFEGTVLSVVTAAVFIVSLAVYRRKKH